MNKIERDIHELMLKKLIILILDSQESEFRIYATEKNGGHSLNYNNLQARKTKLFSTKLKFNR